MLPKQVDRKFRDTWDSWFWRQMFIIWVMWLCLSNQKGELTWSHSLAFGRSKKANASKMHNGVFCKPKRRNFHLWKVSWWKFFRFQPSYTIYKLWPLMCEQQIQQFKNVTMWVHLFGLTNKATCRDSLMSSAKINCHACLWIHSLPVSVVTAKIRHRWLCIIFTLLDHPLMTGLSIFQIDPSTFYFKFWLGSVCKICWHNWKGHLTCKVWKWHHVARNFCEFCDFSSDLQK